jgi:hypothetical protein
VFFFFFFWDEIVGCLCPKSLGVVKFLVLQHFRSYGLVRVDFYYIFTLIWYVPNLSKFIVNMDIYFTITFPHHRRWWFRSIINDI